MRTPLYVGPRAATRSLARAARATSHASGASAAASRRLAVTGVALAVAALLAGCGDVSITIGDGPSVRGSGVSATESRSVAHFEAIEAAGSGKLRLRIGDTDSLKVTADDNILPYLKTEVRNGVLVLSTEGNLAPRSGVTFEVTAKSVTRIENAGTVSIEASGFNGGDFTLGASGVGSATLAGRVDTLKLDLSGVGSVNAEALAADRVIAAMSGVGSGTVRAEKSIKADVSGVGSLTWKGGATEVSTHVSGVGRVSKAS